MASPGTFAARAPQDVVRLVGSHPLAWVVSDGPHATLLPLRAVVAPDGSITQLRGHFARANPQVAALRAKSDALLLFLGPHGYISPSWMNDRTQAPTWNYASAQFRVELSFFEEAEALEELLRDLIGAMEHGRPNPWRQEEMGARFSSLARGIIGFDAKILSSTAKFKLGQDERRDVFADITSALARDPAAAELLQWMLDF
ncbi:FMN-binding negative transcriptional regulator [Roseiterribacter gracilis]|uniref:Transcriptional regulator n=1 Tax=Roseiterribacter gracilis TaxID=2812848 RepID=A0A8S8X8A8_9PROT|nr:transcriptional regulator [Rhodospirillales bacterium TMPK1]